MLRTAVRTVAPLAARSASTAAAPAKRAWAPRVNKPTAASPSRTTPTPAAPIAAMPAMPEEPPMSAYERFDAAEGLDEGLDALLPEIPGGLHAPTIPSFAAPATLTSTATTSLPSLNTGSLPSMSTTFPMGGARAEIPASIPVEQREIDWSTSFHGISSVPFSEKQANTLMRPLTPNEIEVKPDGLLYLPEILYRRILNQAFGPGGWGMVPRGEMTLLKMMVSREWGLVASGRLVSVARGEQTFFNPEGLPTATEGCKSNALMRCCKDLGIASELWDPGFIRTFKAAHCVEAWTEHAASKKKARRWRKKGNKFEYPYVEAK